MPHEQLLTIDEAARYLNVSKTSLRRWTNSGHLPCHRVGVRGERRFSIADLTAFLESSGGTLAEERPAPAPVAERSPMAALEAAAHDGLTRHLCSHFSSVEEWARLIGPYVAHHAERKAPICYIYDSTTPADFAEVVRAAGFDAAALTASGMLELVKSRDAYLPEGVFSIDAMLSFVENVILTRRSRGHQSMLIGGEMTWSLRGAPGTEGMIEYEARLNDLLQRYPGVTINCQYSAEALGAKLTLDALCAHPFVQLPQGLFAGFYRAPAIV